MSFVTSNLCLKIVCTPSGKCTITLCPTKSAPDLEVVVKPGTSLKTTATTTRPEAPLAHHYMWRSRQDANSLPGTREAGDQVVPSAPYPVYERRFPVPWWEEEVPKALDRAQDGGKMAAVCEDEEKARNVGAKRRAWGWPVPKKKHGVLRPKRGGASPRARRKTYEVGGVMKKKKNRRGGVKMMCEAGGGACPRAGNIGPPPLPPVSASTPPPLLATLQDKEMETSGQQQELATAMALTSLSRERPKPATAAEASLLDFPAVPGGPERPAKVTWLTTWDAATGGTTTEVRATYATQLPVGNRPLGITYSPLETPQPVATAAAPSVPVREPAEVLAERLEQDYRGFFWDPVTPSPISYPRAPSPVPDPVQERLLAETIVREMMSGPGGEELALQFTTGIVVKFNQQEGYGFIREVSTGDDYFYNRVHLDVEGLPKRLHTLYPGEKVQFLPEAGSRGLFAVGVTRMPTAREAARWQQELEWEEHQERRRNQPKPMSTDASHSRRTLAVTPEVQSGPTADPEKSTPVVAVNQSVTNRPVIVLDVPQPVLQPPRVATPPPPPGIEEATSSEPPFAPVSFRRVRRQPGQSLGAYIQAQAAEWKRSWPPE
ncbi:uncharacterized protein LOC142310458 [Anomaloglossus baeobatrachus]|uniref:uncharacterized protein LOC142310458 n=1 Tax=Anomaloglossus baeobatrachus TaxID=238106 RepID=UPI003F4F9F1B